MCDKVLNGLIVALVYWMGSKYNVWGSAGLVHALAPTSLSLFLSSSLKWVCKKELQERERKGEKKLKALLFINPRGKQAFRYTYTRVCMYAKKPGSHQEYLLCSIAVEGRKKAGITLEKKELLLLELTAFEPLLLHAI